VTTSILVPLDESRYSHHAVEQALALASRTDTDVRLTGLHVVNVTRLRGRIFQDIVGLLGAEPMVVPERVEGHFVARGERLLARFSEQASAAGVDHTTVLDRGAVVSRIVHHAAGHDLVMMSAHGETEEEFPGQGGSTAERVVRNLVTDALVLSGDGEISRDVAIGFDGSAGSVLAMRAAAHMTHMTGGVIHVFHVAESAPSPDPLDEARRLLVALRATGHLNRVAGEPHEALPAAAAAAGCGTLALGYRGRSQLKDIFLGRTTEFLVGKVQLALLIAR
jgi:nucleotide-binding universal stress UspA family protein